MSDVRNVDEIESFVFDKVKEGEPVNFNEV
jgi:hypothetical protein